MQRIDKRKYVTSTVQNLLKGVCTGSATKQDLIGVLDRALTQLDANRLEVERLTASAVPVSEMRRVLQHIADVTIVLEPDSAMRVNERVHDIAIRALKGDVA